MDDINALIQTIAVAALGIGLMGYFEDLDDAAAQADLENDLGLIDPQTGLMNYRGMLMTGTQYQANYRQNDRGMSR